MITLFEDLVESIAIDFIEAWNKNDMDELQKIIHPDIMVTSPKVKTIYPGNKKSEIIGSHEAIEYWQLLFLKEGQFQVEMIRSSKVGRTLFVQLNVINKDIYISANIKLNGYGKITELHFKYPQNKFMNW